MSLGTPPRRQPALVPAIDAAPVPGEAPLATTAATVLIATHHWIPSFIVAAVARAKAVRARDTRGVMQTVDFRELTNSSASSHTSGTNIMQGEKVVAALRRLPSTCPRAALSLW